MKQTNVFATPEEFEAIKDMVAQADLAAMNSPQRGWIRAEEIMDQCRKKVQALAISHGLPDTEGFYGLGNDGQFTSNY